jgi:predicted secreted protein
MRVIAFVITSGLAAVIACPAMAKTKAPTTRSWMACEELAMQRGVLPQERRSSDKGPSDWRQFMVDCLAGRVAEAQVRAASEPRLRILPSQVPGRWESCDKLAMERGNVEGDRLSSDKGPSPYGQFMRACMRGQVPGA